MPLKNTLTHTNPYTTSLSQLSQLYTHPMQQVSTQRLHQFFSSISLSKATPDTTLIGVLTAYKQDDNGLPQPLLIAYDIPSDKLPSAYEIIDQYKSVILFEITNVSAWKNLSSYFNDIFLYGTSSFYEINEIKYLDIINLLLDPANIQSLNEIIGSQFGSEVETDDQWIGNFPILSQKIQEILDPELQSLIQSLFPDFVMRYMPFLESFHLLLLANKTSVAMTDLAAYQQFVADDEYRMWQSFLQAC